MLLEIVKCARAQMEKSIELAFSGQPTVLQLPDQRKDSSNLRRAVRF